jgi:hypothetical protein
MSPTYIPSSMFTEPAIFESRSKGANAALQNPAVARCCEAWQRAFQDAMSRKNNESDARGWADKAFRNAMPALSGEEGIRDFVACAAHGLLIGTIKEERATKLLYAAQVATTTLARDRRAKNPGKELCTPSPLPGAQQTVENVEKPRPSAVEDSPVTHRNNKG